jgi:hypothetical protein
MHVQHLLADVPEDEKDKYTAVVCLVCTRRHFIHNTTGRVLGEK